MKVKLSIFFVVFIVLFSSVLWAEEHTINLDNAIINLNHDIKNLVYLPKWLKLAAKTIHAIEQEDYDEAIKWAEKLYDYARLYYKDDPHQILTKSAITKANLLVQNAVLAFQRGDYQKTLEFAKKAYTFTRKYFGEEHELTIPTLSVLASAHASQGNYKEAEYWQKKELSLTKNILSEKHQNNVSIFNNLATLYHIQGNYGKAESYYNKAYSLGKNMNYDPLYLWRILNNLGNLYITQDRYEEAKSAYLETTSLRKLIQHDAHIFRPDDPTLPEISRKRIIETNKYLNQIETLQGLAAISNNIQTPK